MSACEGVWECLVWEGCGHVCMTVTVWVGVGGRLCTWAVCGCVSQLNPVICQRLWLPAYGLPVSQDLGIYMGNPPSTPDSCFLITTYSQTLSDPRIAAALKSHIQTSFPIRPMFFLLARSVFLYICALTSWDPPGHRLLYSLSNILCPTFLSCTSLAKSQTCCFPACPCS